MLLIEDEDLVRKLTRRVLRPHEVVESPSADDALARIAENEAFDVILCDLVMPVRGGPEFYRDLSARNPGLAARCLFVCGGATTPDAEAFLASLGPGRVVFKPFSSVQIHAAINRVARRPAHPRPAGA